MLEETANGYLAVAFKESVHCTRVTQIWPSLDHPHHSFLPSFFGSSWNEDHRVLPKVSPCWTVALRVTYLIKNICSHAALCTLYVCGHSVFFQWAPSLSFKAQKRDLSRLPKWSPLPAPGLTWLQGLTLTLRWPTHTLSVSPHIQKPVCLCRPEGLLNQSWPNLSLDLQILGL